MLHGAENGDFGKECNPGLSFVSFCVVEFSYIEGERMSGGGGTQNSLRKALGALKDTTTVSLAKVNSDYKVLVFVCSPVSLLR